MTRLLLPLLSATLLSACANVQHVEVGSVPDDYRTRHPIVVAEGERTLDVPVTSHDRALTGGARSRVDEFANRFREANASSLRVLVPVGATNEAAARHAAIDVVSALRARGIPHERILVSPYPANAAAGPVPIKLAFSELTASAGPCGRWPEDLGNSYENRNYFNFGCASQANLAAQIADPRDLLGPRGRTEIDAARRTQALETYRAGGTLASGGSNSEVRYQW